MGENIHLAITVILNKNFHYSKLKENIPENIAYFSFI